ncbi:MAG TPA: NAD(P)/FAD-dependent oxidoreductase [Thermoanaerobaculia bacterium]|nr:NAD(P)/FAD-dependent oxidoreductase [Thermoanaerobaculia bacterium]
MEPSRPHVVILGAGFGGLYAARALYKAPVRLTIIDRQNHHLFQPLLYQVATAALNPSDIAAPIRSILRRQENAAVILGSARSIDRESRKVILAEGEVAFDYLIVATGATHSYFGNEEWAEHAPGLKSIDDALEIRRRILLAYEAAEREMNEELQKEWMTFVVIGGGPTGVELAGALAEIARHTFPRDFRRIDTRSARIILLEGLPRLLNTYPEDLSEKARRQLERIGVEVRIGTKVTSIDSRSVVAGAERIATRTKIWAAGVQASPLVRSLEVPLDRAGRVLVETDLTIPGSREIFVIGDLAAVRHGESFVPGVAPAAIQEGRHAAMNVVKAIDGDAMAPFVYHDKGSLATIGRASAVADLGWLKLSGPIAWVTWIMIHIATLIGYRNRLLVLLQWAWSWATFQRGARLITGRPTPLPDEERD